LTLFSLFCLSARAAEPARKAVLEAELAKLNSAIKANPDDATQYFTRGCIYRVLEKWDLASQDFTATIDRKSHDWEDEAYEGRGICRMQLGLHQDALSDFNFALKLNAGLFEARANRAYLLYRMGHAGRALPEINALLAMPKYRQNALLRLYRAKVRYALKDFDGSLSDANAALAVEKNNVDAGEERARVLLARNQRAQAMSELTSLIARAPKRGSLWGLVSLVHYGDHDYKQTILNSGKAYELGYYSAELLAACADSYGQVGEMENSINSANEAIKMNPSIGLAYLARGRAYRALKRADLANADFEKASKLGYREQ
jgi:tetratricopeptide (TPR) repeat protein